MKVLMLGWELPPDNSGGLGVACYQLCKKLAEKDTDIEFVLPYRSDLAVSFMKVTAAYPQDAQAVMKAGSAYESLRYVFASGDEAWLDIFGQEQLYEQAVGRLVASRQFDIIHAHDWLTFRAAIKAKQVAGVPLIVHVHSTESDRAGGNYGNPLAREIEALGLMLADHIIAVSQKTKNSIVHDYAISPDKITVIHNSIDKFELPKLETDNIYHYLSFMKTKGYKVVTNVGRLTIQKGITNLLRAAKEVVYRQPKTIFLIVGAGDQYFELIELAAELGIARNVIFAGFQRGQAWRDAFGIADLFVMPSVSEPFGITPLEALNYGTPSLISKQSGVSEVLKNCLKVDCWDINEMANQIAAALGSNGLCRELAANAQGELANLSWDDSAEKLQAIYGRHLEGAPK